MAPLEQVNAVQSTPDIRDSLTGGSGSVWQAWSPCAALVSSQGQFWSHKPTPYYLYESDWNSKFEAFDGQILVLLLQTAEIQIGICTMEKERTSFLRDSRNIHVARQLAPMEPSDCYLPLIKCWYDINPQCTFTRNNPIIEHLTQKAVINYLWEE